MRAAVPERVVLFGAEGGFARPLLGQLLAHGVDVVGVVVATGPAPGSHRVLAQCSADPASLAALAESHRLAVTRIASANDPQLPGALNALAADVVLVGCFPWKLPASIAALAQRACWNLHPSLLPRYRGPAPLYWQLREREARTGLTLHEVTGRLDAGAIVGQRPLALPAQRDGATLDRWVAEHGAGLFVDTLALLRQGRLAARPQDEAAASYRPKPG